MRDDGHPFTQCAQTIGGILKINGFEHFLANFSLRKSEDDTESQSMGLLGATFPSAGGEGTTAGGGWLAPGDWARRAVDSGLVPYLIDAADRGSDKGRERGMGCVLSRHVDETFYTTTDEESLVLRLEKARRRFVGSKASTRYRFLILERKPLPADDDPNAAGGESARNQP